MQYAPFMDAIHKENATVFVALRHEVVYNPGRIYNPDSRGIQQWAVGMHQHTLQQIKIVL